MDIFCAILILQLKLHFKSSDLQKFFKNFFRRGYDDLHGG